MPTEEEIEFAADIIFKKYDEGHSGILHADEIHHLISDAHVYLGIKGKVKDSELWGFINNLHPQEGSYVTIEDLYIVMKRIMKVD